MINLKDVWNKIEQKRKEMEDKHFEPVTARSLATEIARLGIGPNFRNIEHYINQVESLLEPHIRKPSDDDKSVPERCEEAYNEAVRIIKNFVDTFELAFISDTNSRKAEEFLKKPNPFKEADIVHEDDTEPTLLPFSLEDAKNGAKVVTRGGDSVKILCDDLYGQYPIIAVVTRKNGNKVSMTTTLDGKSVIGSDGINDLFILKELETLKIGIYRNKRSNRVFAHNYDDPLNTADHGAFSEVETVKTITVTI